MDLELESEVPKVTFRAQYSKVRAERTRYLTKELAGQLKLWLKYKYRKHRVCTKEDRMITVYPESKPTNLVFAHWHTDESKSPGRQACVYYHKAKILPSSSTHLKQDGRMITGRDLLPVSAVFGTGTFGSYWTLREDLVAQRKKQAYISSGIKAIFIASDVMTPNPITISEDGDLADARYIMLRNRISGLPVVDSNKRS
jgi:CBS domain